MSLLVPNIGEATMLANIVNKTSPENLVLRLYTNNKTPAETDVASDFTEASGFGYAGITLTGATWTVTQGAPGNATYPIQTFTFTGAIGNIYGYFITQVSSGLLMFAEIFSNGPYNMQNSGEQVKVTVQLTLD